MEGRSIPMANRVLPVFRLTAGQAGSSLGRTLPRSPVA